MTIMFWSLIALFTGFILDLLFGDPYRFPHIVRRMGSLITILERKLRKNLPATQRAEKLGGTLLVMLVILICACLPFVILIIAYRFNSFIGYIIESFLCWQLIAAKSLKTESMKVYNSLMNDDLEEARKNVSMIVGRDTAELNKDEITRAAVETVAENTSDGVIAPLFYIMLGGAWLGCLYKAVNTMDSMLGYKNENYINFGRTAAKTDDVLNYIPARLCAWLMIIAAFLLRFDGKNAIYIWRRDRHKHASPNAAQAEAVCAGALGIQLAGPISYHGKVVDKPYIGDNRRPIQAEDIKYANRLMLGTAVLAGLLTILFRLISIGVMFHAAI